MTRQPNLTLQTLTTSLLQEETLNKSINATADSMSALYIGKRSYVSKGKNTKNLANNHLEEGKNAH